MLELRAMGLHISVDDFGKGFSSLSALEELALDEFKIDPSFVSRLESGRGEAVISAVLALGRSLGKQVVVEGIETADQHNLLLKLGCELGQGHLFGKPLAADDVEHLISESAPSLRVAYTRPSAGADGGLRARSTPGPNATP
jgi:EAL domain-containing protein (putative c-di-GMP-specific phosphodiesterase class I)